MLLAALKLVIRLPSTIYIGHRGGEGRLSVLRGDSCWVFCNRLAWIPLQGKYLVLSASNWVWVTMTSIPFVCWRSRHKVTRSISTMKAQNLLFSKHDKITDISTKEANQSNDASMVDSPKPHPINLALLKIIVSIIGTCVVWVTGESEDRFLKRTTRELSTRTQVHQRATSVKWNTAQPNWDSAKARTKEKKWKLEATTV